MRINTAERDYGVSGESDVHKGYELYKRRYDRTNLTKNGFFDALQ